MPHKFNAGRRHKFAKKQYRVTNWAEYNESLRNRGDLTIWIADNARPTGLPLGAGRAVVKPGWRVPKGIVKSGWRPFSKVISR